MTKPANGNAVGWHRMAGGHVRRPDLVLPSPYGFKRTNPATALLDKRFVGSGLTPRITNPLEKLQV